MDQEEPNNDNNNIEAITEEIPMITAAEEEEVNSTGRAVRKSTRQKTLQKNNVNTDSNNRSSTEQSRTPRKRGNKRSIEDFSQANSNSDQVPIVEEQFETNIGDKKESSEEADFDEDDLVEQFDDSGLVSNSNINKTDGVSMVESMDEEERRELEALLEDDDNEEFILSNGSAFFDPESVKLEESMEGEASIIPRKRQTVPLDKIPPGVDAKNLPEKFRPRARASVIWMFYKSHNRNQVECLLCGAGVIRSDGHSTKGMWTHMKKHPEKMIELGVSFPDSIVQIAGETSSDVMLHNLIEARRANGGRSPVRPRIANFGPKHPCNRALLEKAEGGSGKNGEEIQPSPPKKPRVVKLNRSGGGKKVNANETSNSTIGEFDQMDINNDEEERNREKTVEIVEISPEDAQQQNGNVAESSNERRSNRQRKKNPRFDQQELVMSGLNWSTVLGTQGEGSVGPPLTAYIEPKQEMPDEQPSFNEDSMVIEPHDVSGTTNQTIGGTTKRKRPRKSITGRRSSRPAQNLNLATPGKKVIPSGILPISVSRESTKFYEVPKISGDGEGGDPATINELLQAHREQTEQINLLLKDNEDLRKQNELLVRQNADILARLNVQGLVNNSSSPPKTSPGKGKRGGPSGGKKLNNNFTLNGSSGGSRGSAALSVQRTFSDNSGIDNNNVVTSNASGKNTSSTGGRKAPRLISSLLDEEPVVHVHSADRRRGKSSPTKRHMKREMGLSPTSDPALVKARLSSLKLTAELSRLIGDRKPHAFTPRNFGDWHSLASTDQRRAQAAELFRSLKDSGAGSTRSAAENLDYAFFLENEAFSGALNKDDYLTRLAERQAAFYDSMSAILGGSGESVLPPDQQQSFADEEDFDFDEDDFEPFTIVENDSSSRG